MALHALLLNSRAGTGENALRQLTVRLTEETSSVLKLEDTLRTSQHFVKSARRGPLTV